MFCTRTSFFSLVLLRVREGMDLDTAKQQAREVMAGQTSVLSSESAVHVQGALFSYIGSGREAIRGNSLSRRWQIRSNIGVQYSVSTVISSGFGILVRSALCRTISY